MTTMNESDWRPVLIEGHGLQAHLAREWPCLPAWDVYAIYPRADEYVPYPACAAAVEAPPKDDPRVETGMPVFWNRHIDRRYSLDYPRAAKDTPRSVSWTVGDADREWEMIREQRDKILTAAGLTPASPPRDIARALAEAFKWASPFYHTKPPSAVIDGQTSRALHHPVEALLTQCFCVGCANLYAALADSAGLTVRNVGLHGHYAAEVLLDDGWHYIENTCRHEKSKGLEAFFPASWMDIVIHPENYLDHMPPRKAGNYWGADNGDYCLTGGSWRSPKQMLFAADCAGALYPHAERWGFKCIDHDDRHMPLVRRSQGFLWMDYIFDGETDRMVQRLQEDSPFPLKNSRGHRLFLYHPLKPRDRLRHSVWLDALDDMEALEVTIPLAPEPHIDFSEALGRRLKVEVNDWSATLADSEAWPPAPHETTEQLHCVLRVPTDALKPHAVNWIALRQESTETLQVPFTVAALDPYLPPLATES